jgi:hypothetical protein
MARLREKIFRKEEQAVVGKLRIFGGHAQHDRFGLEGHVEGQERPAHQEQRALLPRIVRKLLHHLLRHETGRLHVARLECVQRNAEPLGRTLDGDRLKVSRRERSGAAMRGAGACQQEKADYNNSRKNNHIEFPCRSRSTSHDTQPIGSINLIIKGAALPVNKEFATPLSLVPFSS